MAVTPRPTLFDEMGLAAGSLLLGVVEVADSGSKSYGL